MKTWRVVLAEDPTVVLAAFEGPKARELADTEVDHLVEVHGYSRSALKVLEG